MSDHFYGWYFRCQGEDGTLAVIPAVHKTGGRWSCSVQVITQWGSWNQDFPIRQFRINQKKGIMQIGENIFSKKGIRLNLVTCSHLEGNRSFRKIQGILRFGLFTEPGYDIMGPFRYVPGMECRHAVYSMEHRVDGELQVEDRKLRFAGARGYMEGDSGRSFPEKYVWTQHFCNDGSFMLAAATIPFLGLRFTGTTGILLKKGRQYRFATYLGASVRMMQKGRLQIRQGKYTLNVRLPEGQGNVLSAPDKGRMSRRIREEISCRAEYALEYEGRTLWKEQAECAAAEWEAETYASGKGKRNIVSK